MRCRPLEGRKGNSLGAYHGIVACPFENSGRMCSQVAVSGEWGKQRSGRAGRSVGVTREGDFPGVDGGAREASVG